MLYRYPIYILAELAELRGKSSCMSVSACTCRPYPLFPYHSVAGHDINNYSSVIIHVMQEHFDSTVRLDYRNFYQPCLVNISHHTP